MIEVLLKTVGEAGGFKVSRGDLAELSRLQDEWKSSRDAMLASTDTAARQAWSEHLKELGKKSRVAGGLQGEDGFSWPEWQAEFQTKMSAARAEMNRITMEAVPMAGVLCEKFCDTANQVAADIEKTEAKMHSDFGVPYAPSGLVLKLRQAASLARNRVPTGNQYANCSPAAMLPVFNPRIKFMSNTYSVTPNSVPARTISYHVAKPVRFVEMFHAAIFHGRFQTSGDGTGQVGYWRRDRPNESVKFRVRGQRCY